jgi:hypothetical protein
MSEPKKSMKDIDAKMTVGNTSENSLGLDHRSEEVSSCSCIRAIKLLSMPDTFNDNITQASCYGYKYFKHPTLSNRSKKY